LGLGAGWYEPEYDAAGIDYDDPGTRIRRLREAATIVARLLDGDEVTFTGDHYDITGAVVRPRPRQDPGPPIWIGGKGDFLLRTAARVADGWNYSWLGSIDTYRDRSAAADRACEKEGRDPKTLRRSTGVYVVAGTDDNDARRRFERLADRTPAGVLNHSSNGSTAVSWDEFRARAFAGTVAEVTDRLGELAEMGVEEAILTLGALPFQVSDLDDVDLVGTEIAPALR
ncbi:MAG: LLM class flavin-dependent oxidoreductase, partial [Actinobacteria bacterium]|nr:LLM class flavin-dependent oxidoreductase [Actinomycetota bacterium]